MKQTQSNSLIIVDDSFIQEEVIEEVPEDDEVLAFKRAGRYMDPDDAKRSNVDRTS